MIDALKKIYPGITEDQFRLQDDGSGPYISFWDYDQPQPTMEQIIEASQTVVTETAIAAAHARINAEYEARVNALTSGYPPNEIASWPKQEAEARAYLANPAAPTPWIDNAATLRGISRNHLVSLIINNANALAPIHGMLTGMRQRLRDQIDALGPNPTAQQLDAIQWPQGGGG